MLGQFRSPRTGRIYRDASPGARYERRYTMSLYCSTLPREKRGENCWNTPTSKQLALTNAQLGTRQLRKRCGEIVNHPCGVEALYHLHPSINGFHGPRHRKPKCLQQAKLEVLDITVYARYSTAFPARTCANLFLQYRHAIAHRRL